MFLDIPLSIIWEGERVQDSKGMSQKALTFKVSHDLKFIFKWLRCHWLPRLQPHSSIFQPWISLRWRQESKCVCFVLRKHHSPLWYAVCANQFRPEQQFNSWEWAEAHNYTDTQNAVGEPAHGHSDRCASDSSQQWARTWGQVSPYSFIPSREGRTVGLWLN